MFSLYLVFKLLSRSYFQVIYNLLSFSQVGLFLYGALVFSLGKYKTVYV